MPPMVCRLKYRKGEPLGLSIYPAPTFVSLPLEIRNQIYALLLVAPEPVTVFSVSPNTLLPGQQLCADYKRQPGLAALTLGLLYVNRLISREAVPIFYRENAFKLGGPPGCHLVDSRDPLYSFLFATGVRLRTLGIGKCWRRGISLDPASGMAFRQWGARYALHFEGTAKQFPSLLDRSF